MNTVNPLLVFTGLALASLAALAGVTYDRWSPQESGPQALLAEAQSNAPGTEKTTEPPPAGDSTAVAKVEPPKLVEDLGQSPGADQQTIEKKQELDKPQEQPAAAGGSQDVAETAPRISSAPEGSTGQSPPASEKTVQSSESAAKNAGTDTGAADTKTPPEPVSSEQATAEAAKKDVETAIPESLANNGEPAAAPTSSPEADKTPQTAEAEQKIEKTSPETLPEPPKTAEAPAVEQTPASEDSPANKQIAALPEASQDLPKTAEQKPEAEGAGPDAAKTPAETPPPAEKKPSFDTVRVETTGDAIAAGEAAPGSEVTLKLDGKVIGKATANHDGSWVVVPDKPLPAGAGALSVEQKQPGQEKTVSSEQTIAVFVPPQPDKKPMVALVEPDAPVRIIQTPAQEKPAAIKGKVALDSIDYNDNGDILFSGRTDAGAAVRLYIDNHAKGDAVADASGRWFFTGRTDIPAGTHALRIDRIDDGGKVVSRIELPFVREEASKVAALVAPPVAIGKPGTEAAPKQDSAQAKPEQTVAKAEPEPQPGKEQPAAPRVTVEAKTSAPPPVETQQEPASTVVEKSSEQPTQPDFVPPPPPEAAEEIASSAPPAVLALEQQAPAPASTSESEVAAVAPAPPPETPREGHIVIQPGNNLWKLSRVIYGRGTHYTIIYEANKDQIRNPSRIYPGQIFSTPNATPPDKIDPKRKQPLTAAEGGATLQ